MIKIVGVYLKDEVIDYISTFLQSKADNQESGGNTCFFPSAFMTQMFAGQDAPEYNFDNVKR